MNVEVIKMGFMKNHIKYKIITEKRRLNQIYFLGLVVFFSVLLTACGGGQAIDDAENYVSNIDQIDIPSNVKIIGFGEATHGNIELQNLKKELFEAFIQNENVRVFVLEGDFGGGHYINEFILTGKGTAEEAVDALDYGIYKTDQMIDFIQWMHDYNTKVSEDEKVYFYGNDMQRFDDSKTGLLDYYETVDVTKAKEYTEQLEQVSNDSMWELTTKYLEELDEILENIILDLKSNEADYVKQSSSDSFTFALQFAQVMKQRTQLLLNEENYMQLRDQYLAENLEWIVEYEAARGHDKVLFSGHNGHVEKTSASLANYESMGSYLDDLYGADYFAIGSDLMKSKFQAFNSGKDKRAVYSISNHNKLVDAFKKVEPNIFYVGFDRASESAELSDIIKSKQKMVNIGDDFRGWYKVLKMFYTIEMTPEEAYDGIIIIKESTPTTVIE